MKKEKPALEQLGATLGRRWDPASPYLVAVSGGVDSIVLWHLLRTHGFGDLVVVHVDHGLRGKESTEDAAFVKEQANRWGNTCEIRHVEVREEAGRRKRSLETMAREMRYAAIAEVARERRCPRVFLAHHSDDRVETVLMHLFRGSGARGLGGMREESTRTVDGVAMHFFRPLLGVDRPAIQAYAARHDLLWREDASNESDFALRNRIRHRLLPEIESIFGRNPREAILRAADLAALDEAWAEEMLGDPPRRANGLDVAILRTFPEAKRNRILLAWLREACVPDCGYAEVLTASKILLGQGRPAKGNLPGGFHVRRRSGVLFIEAPA